MSIQKTVSRQLRVGLTDKERVELGKDLANTTQSLAQINDDLKAVKQDFGSRKTASEAKIASLSTTISNGYRISEVHCEWLMDTPEAGKKQLVRLDTKEVVETLDMIDADRQGNLPLADPNGDAATVKTVVDSDPETGVVTVPADRGETTDDDDKDDDEDEKDES